MINAEIIFFSLLNVLLGMDNESSLVLKNLNDSSLMEVFKTPLDLSASSTNIPVTFDWLNLL